jgi:predicted HAD superfamily Cof-like phosphohydrolase
MSLSIEEAINAVKTFHEAFGIQNADSPIANLSKEQIDLRYRLMQEENEEYLESARENNLAEIADALGDQLYILCGTILKHGLQDKIAAIFMEIHRSNMSKLDKNGRPIYREDGKVLKSDQYFKPNITGILDAK